MPRKKKEPAELSASEIQEQLSQMEADKKALETALKKKRASELSGFVKEIRDQIIERGYEVDQVIAALSKGGRKASSRRQLGDYARYVDPENPDRGYTRGPLPKWLQEMMTASGFDPADKAQREEFKEKHLQKVA
jgi:hypothetical protein